MSQKILWIDDDVVLLEPYVQHLASQLPSYMIEIEKSITEAEGRIKSSVHDPYELIILDVMISPSEVEEVAYPPYATNFGIETGLAFIRRVKSLLVALGTKVLVLTQRLDKDIENEFLKESMPNLVFERKVEVPTVSKFSERVVKILKTKTDEVKVSPTTTIQATNYISIGTMVNSQIQQGSKKAKQTLEISANDLKMLDKFIREYKKQVPKLGLRDSTRKRVEKNINAIQKQVSSKKPKINIVKGGLESLKTILEGAAGNLLAAKLMEQLPNILAMFSGR
jgi:hypothetical protein